MVSFYVYSGLCASVRSSKPPLSSSLSPSTYTRHDIPEKPSMIVIKMALTTNDFSYCLVGVVVISHTLIAIMCAPTTTTT